MKCLSLFPYSNIIIAENMDVYEVYIDGKTALVEDIATFSEEYFVRKLPMKANLDWDKAYGDDGTNNWCCDHLPWYEENGKLIWDY